MSATPYAYIVLVTILAWLAGIFSPRLSAQPVGAARQRSAAAVVLELEGTVEFSAAGSTRWDPGYTNQVLEPGDLLRTGPRSRAAGQRSDRSTWRIPERTTMRVPSEAAKSGLLNLLRGFIYFFHRDKPQEFPVETPAVYAVVLGTEFTLEVADDGTTTLHLIDGQVQLTNQSGRLQLISGESAIVVPGKPPQKTAVIEAVNVIQWCLYYPAVLDVDELELEAAEEAALRDSLEAYRSGDLLAALAKYPADRLPVSDREKIYRAALLLAVGQVEEAQKELNQLNATDGQTARMASLARALQMLIAAVKLQPLPSTANSQSSTRLATEWLAESYYEQSQSRLEQALLAARKAVQTRPKFAFGWARVAEMEFSFAGISEAKQAVERSLNLAPRHAEALSVKGFLLAAHNHIPEAITYFDRAIAIDGALGNAWLGRGLCRIRRGEAEAGRQDLQMAVTLEPQRAALRSYLGKAWSHTAEDEEASQELELAKKFDPNDPTAWLYAALLNQRRNRINEAVRELEQSQERNDNRAVYRSRLLLDQDRSVRGANLASIYHDAGMFDVSVREAVQAVNADYANYSAHLFLANSYNALRDPNQINLRYETPWLSEYLLANLLAPAGIGALSQRVSQQEYSRLFERDRVGLVSATEYLSRGDWLQAGAQFGTFGNFSYALEAFYQSRNGQRSNNELDQRTLSLQLKQQITPRDSVFFQAIAYEAESGHVGPVFDPEDTNMVNLGLRTIERQEPLLLAGYHHEWAPGVHSLVLAGRLQDTFKVSNPSQATLTLGRDAADAITDAITTLIEQDYRSELEIYTAELQQIFQPEPHTFIVGGRYQAGEFRTRNEHGKATVLGFDPPFSDILQMQLDALPGQNVAPDIERVTVYGYHHWQVLPPLRLIAGVTYDRLTSPRNFRYAPLSDEEEQTDRVSPKAGLIWTPAKNVVVRAGYTRSLGGVSFDQSFQLEPTQVAGFNQSWRSIIPESVTGANSAEEFETWGVSIEEKLWKGTYLGLAGELLRSEAARHIGVFDVDTTFLPSLGETRERLDYEERSLILTINQLVGDEWSIGARYRLSEAELDDRFTAIPSSAPTTGGFKARQELESLLHQLNLFSIYTHPSGLFGQVESLWYGQNNRGYSPKRPGDDFWQFNAFLGYRFAKRRAELTLGLLNITDQDYRLNPLNITSELPRDRTLLLSLRFAL